MLKLLRTPRRYLSVVLASVVALLAVFVLLGSTSSVALARPIPPAPCTQEHSIYQKTTQSDYIAHYKLIVTIYAQYNSNNRYCGKMMVLAVVTRQGYDDGGGNLELDLNDVDNKNNYVQDFSTVVSPGGNTTAISPQLSLYAPSCVYTAPEFHWGGTYMEQDTGPVCAY